MLNIIVYGESHAEWAKKNKNIEGNQRDNGTVEQLVVMSNLETINAMLIHQKKDKKERAQILYDEAQRLIKSLTENKSVKKLK